MIGRAWWLLAGGFFVLAAMLPRPVSSAEHEAVKRGAYIYHVAGCRGCHTDVKGKGAELAGGRALKTPFGTFYGPNITPDSTHGIGAWTEADFVRALRQGRAPDGANYFPVFPYASFTRMRDRDLADLWAYLRSRPAVAQANRPHEIAFPYNIRALVTPWKWLYFTPGAMRADPKRPATINRGAYLVRALAHCGECHTPRGALGGPEDGMFLAGAADGPEGETVPNITPDPETGIGKWSRDDLLLLLQAGIARDGDVVGGLMGAVVDESSSKLSATDRGAVAAYLRSILAIGNKVRKKK